MLLVVLYIGKLPGRVLQPLGEGIGKVAKKECRGKLAGATAGTPVGATAEILVVKESLRLYHLYS